MKETAALSAAITHLPLETKEQQLVATFTHQSPTSQGEISLPTTLWLQTSKEVWVCCFVFFFLGDFASLLLPFMLVEELSSAPPAAAGPARQQHSDQPNKLLFMINKQETA